MEKVVYKETVIGKTWENKLDNFIAKMETKFPMDDKALIRELANNIMVRDLILDVTFGVTEEKKQELFEQFNKLIEDHYQ